MNLLPAFAPPSASRLQNAVVVALVTAGVAMLLGLTPVARLLESEVALPWLFALRGPITPPEKVAVVSLDRQSDARPDLPVGTWNWPRSVVADLIEDLTRRGASTIVLDLPLD